MWCIEQLSNAADHNRDDLIMLNGFTANVAGTDRFVTHFDSPLLGMGASDHLVRSLSTPHYEPLLCVVKKELDVIACG
jgi:hypothetical protein